MRTDIYDEIFEGVDERNNTTASDSALHDHRARRCSSACRCPTTLSPGQQRLYRVTVGAGETLSVALDAADNLSANELYVRYGDVASRIRVRLRRPAGALGRPEHAGALHRGRRLLRPDPGPVGQRPTAPVNADREGAAVHASPTSSQDQGGDSRWVTVTITGARFRPGAIVKLVRPGIAEFEPVRYEVVDATRIIATFDLRNVPHGLYDVAVINPGGALAVLPYRYLSRTRCRST